MPKDERDVLELFREELDFIEKGGYGRSVRTPWKPTSAFQDSLTCLNFGSSDRSHSCEECHLIDFVPTENRADSVPCHQIAIGRTGETVATLENEENQQKLEETMKQWLRARISQIEDEHAVRESHRALSAATQEPRVARPVTRNLTNSY